MGRRLFVGEPGALDNDEVALVLAACLRVFSAISLGDRVALFCQVSSSYLDRSSVLSIV